MEKSKWILDAEKYESKAKELRRKESEFWKNVDMRKDEILERFGVKIDEACPTHSTKNVGQHDAENDNMSEQELLQQELRNELEEEQNENARRYYSE